MSISQQVVEQLIAYLELIQYWNSRFNLTSIRDPSLIVRHHFIDSLAIAPFIHPNDRLVDIGSGAGFPGIPLKTIFPEKKITLIESQRKKVSFLREVIRNLCLEGIDVHETRVENIKGPELTIYDEAVARAFGSLEKFLKASWPFLRPGGRALFMSGPKGNKEYLSISASISNLGFDKGSIEHYRLPTGGEERTLLIFLKN